MSSRPDDEPSGREERTLVTETAPNATSTATPIQDNSFLIEEAYNQEDGIIQHIGTFERLTDSHD